MREVKISHKFCGDGLLLLKGKNELVMKESILMRVLFCKIHCPFICFCKPSAAHIYTSAPLKLENTPQHLVASIAIADGSESDSSSSVGVKEEGLLNGNQQDVLKSCIRKISSESDENKEKKRVKWKDNSGKELVEIKEFESSETADTDDEEGGSRCLCLIL